MRLSPGLAGLVLAAAALAACRTVPADSPPPRDGVLVHLGTGPRDPHAVTMALKMAALMRSDHDVLVYLDLDAVRLVLREGPDVQFGPIGSSRHQIRELLDAGVPVLACPSCLAAAGRGPDDLIPGVAVASKEPLFGFTRGRILTIDY